MPEERNTKPPRCCHTPQSPAPEPCTFALVHLHFPVPSCVLCGQVTSSPAGRCGRQPHVSGSWDCTTQENPLRAEPAQQARLRAAPRGLASPGQHREGLLAPRQSSPPAPKSGSAPVLLRGPADFQHCLRAAGPPQHEPRGNGPRGAPWACCCSSQPGEAPGGMLGAAAVPGLPSPPAPAPAATCGVQRARALRSLLSRAKNTRWRQLLPQSSRPA